MYSLDRTTYTKKTQRPVVAGTVIADEGLLLKSVLVGGDEHVALAGTGAGEILVGFSHDTTVALDSEIVIEDGLTVPAGKVIQLAHGNIVAGSVRVHKVSTNADLAITTDYSVNLSNGIVTLVANAGEAVIVTYRRNLTVTEAKIKYFERPSNFPSPADSGNAIILTGDVEIYTDMYDTSVSYDGVTELYAGAGGMLTSVATGHTAVPGHIIKLPTAADPFIGYLAKF